MLFAITIPGSPMVLTTRASKALGELYSIVRLQTKVD